MSFQIDCPHCHRVVNVTEKAYGKVLPCPGCNQLMQVPQPPSWSAPAPSTPPAMPTGMPPLPHAGDNNLALPIGIGGNDVTSAHQSGAARRPFGIVWIVFYWIFTGLWVMVYGLVMQIGGGVAVAAAAAMEENFGHSAIARGAISASVILEIVGLLVFHLGLLTLVACYGLWTLRKWGLALARPLAVIHAVLWLLGIVGALVSRVAIASNLAFAAIAVAIVIYLFGSDVLYERFQQFYSRLRRSEGQQWDGYQ